MLARRLTLERFLRMFCIKQDGYMMRTKCLSKQKPYWRQRNLCTQGFIRYEGTAIVIFCLPRGGKTLFSGTQLMRWLSVGKRVMGYMLFLCMNFPLPART